MRLAKFTSNYQTHVSHMERHPVKKLVMPQRKVSDAPEAINNTSLLFSPHCNARCFVWSGRGWTSKCDLRCKEIVWVDFVSVRF